MSGHTFMVVAWVAIVGCLLYLAWDEWYAWHEARQHMRERQRQTQERRRAEQDDVNG